MGRTAEGGEARTRRERYFETHERVFFPDEAAESTVGS
jgi:hypothetical protein